jgi:hypothetical protein
LKSRDILIATAGVAIYPFPRTKSSAQVDGSPNTGKACGILGFFSRLEAKNRLYWKLSNI